MQKNRNTPAHILQKYAPDADYSALADYAFGITTIDGVRIPPEQITQESDLLSSDNQQPSQRVDEANDINNHLPQGGDEQVEEEHFPGVRYLDDDNNRSYPAYERPPPSSVSPWLTPAFLSRLGEPDIPNVSRLRRLVPRRTKLYITNMDDLRREAARGERGFQVIVRDIDSKGWAAAFDDVFKWLKWSKYGFYTPEHFGDWWFLGETRGIVRDAADVLARTAVPQDGYYGSDSAGTPYEATPEHLAGSVAGTHNKVKEGDKGLKTEGDDGLL